MTAKEHIPPYFEFLREAGTKKIKHEEVFDVDVHYFEMKVDFLEVVKVKSEKGNKVLKGRINFMTCDKHRCITDEEEFSVVPK